MLILEKHSCLQIPLLMRKKIKKACNLCKTYKLYWSVKGNLGCKIVHQRDIMIRPTHELPFPLITIVAEPQPGDT